MRLFLALWPPTEAAEQLAGIAQSAARQFGGKPTRQETIHLTLAFLGEVPEDQVPLLAQTVQAIRAAPFRLNIDCLGYWRRNHLLWAGSDSTCIALAELVENLQSSLAKAGFAVDGRNRTFTPHITLIRKLPETREPFALPAIDTISWLCSSFALVRSKTSDAGSYYQTISDFRLRQR
jgi:RNA 2',3'-cyclic 3'-phosphodiesterase